MKHPPGKRRWGDAHAEDVVAQGGDAQTRRAGLNFNAITPGLETGYRFERNVGLRGRGSLRGCGSECDGNDCRQTKQNNANKDDLAR